VLQDGAAICEAAHEVGALVIGDCVTSLGNVPTEVDATGIDIAYSCSQKGLGCVPGLAPITVSARALAVLEARTRPVPSFYLDLLLMRDYWAGPSTTTRPPLPSSTPSVRHSTSSTKRAWTAGSGA